MVARPDSGAGRVSTGMTIRSTPAQRWTLVLGSAAAFMVALDGLVVTTALSTIRSDLDASIAQLEWTINAFTLSFAALLMTGAALGDRFGRRRMMVSGLALFAAASAGCALAPDAAWLIAGRAVQGIGAALVSPVALALVTGAFPPERRGWALGVFSATVGLGVLLGPVLGGAITEGIAWEWIFWLNVPIGLALAALSMARIDERHGPRATPDLGGAALVIVASLSIVWGLVRANSSGWGSVEVVATLLGGLLVAIAFVAWELRARQPMLPMRLFASRAFSAGNAVSFLLFASNLSLTFFFAQFHQVALGQSPLDAGLRLLPWTAPIFLLAPRAGALADSVGERPLVVGGLALQAAGTAWLALIAGADTAYAAMLAPMIITGAGTAMAMPSCQKAVVGAVAPPDIGKASGTFTTMRWFGGVFGIAVAVAVFAETGGYTSAETFSDGFAAAAAVSAGFALVGALAGLGVGHTRLSATVAATARPQPEA
jgi:EmrB/QacA subfamily drug resistance transporter